MYQEITTDQYREDFDQLVTHPLQSWEWGEFRQHTGVKVVRLAKIVNGKISSPLQVFFHKLPLLNWTVGYLPKGLLPDKDQIDILRKIGKQNRAIFIQLEPNVKKTSKFEFQKLKLTPAARPLFTKYTFYIDLTKSDDEFLKSFSPKTRYNIRLAQKHGVTIQEENTNEAFNRYLELTWETTKRQGFYAHDENYHRLMWMFLQPKGIAHLLTARYQNQILVTWILFLFNNVLYYPYGASSTKHKHVMASNLMMWEAIKFGKKRGAKIFDLWGTPGPSPKPDNPYYGFHKFKLGYSPKLIEFIGSYDLILNPLLYKLFNLINKIRWFILRKK